MPTIVDFPTIGQEALTVFGGVVDTEAARRHVAAYLTGLIVAANQTGRGINRALALTTDQSCLHRWLTEGEWDVTALHDRRLAWRHQVPQTRDSGRGGMALDKMLGTHEGKRIEDVGWCWDHAEQRHVMAHDDILSHYVCPSGAHSPIAWRRFQTQDACAAGKLQAHTRLCRDLSDDAITRARPGDGPCDRYFPSAKVLKHLQSQPRAEGGDLQLHRKGVSAGQEPTRQDGARPMPWAAKKPGRMGSPRSWSCSTQRRMPAVTHPGRIVLLWRARDDEDARQARGSNRRGGEVRRRVLGDRHRWTGTATWHRDGKQPGGLGDGQGRSGAGQTRHVALVRTASSLLRRSLPQVRPQHWARRTLTTIGEACRAVKTETLERGIDWMVEKLTMAHWSVPDMKAVLVQS